MFLAVQIFLRASGHTVTATSPRCAVRRRYMNVRVADPAADRQRDAVVEDFLVARQLQEVELAAQLELRSERLLGTRIPIDDSS